MRALVIALLLIAAPAWAGKVRITTTEVVLADPIHFDVGKATIKPISRPILDELAVTLSKNTKLSLVEIQVHTDARGNDKFNLEMSQKRAQAIYEYLVGKGVDANRLRATGYGESKPVDGRANERAWAKNRRTVFVILQRMT